MTRLQTVVELNSFLKRAKVIMSDDERMGIVVYASLRGAKRRGNPVPPSLLDCRASLAMTTG